MRRSSRRNVPASMLTSSLHSLVPALPWKPVAERGADGRLRFRELELIQGCESAALEHCGCAAGSPGDPETYCEYCLPRRLIFEVGLRSGMAEFFGEVHFRLVGLRDDNGTRLATYEYWT